jgi:hypothetical protein
MRHVVNTGTDGATVCFFDPEALPADFDERVRDDSIQLFDDLMKAGRFWWKNTGGDGDYLFHFYIDAEVPAPIRKRLEEPDVIKNFVVSSGTLWACGAEYAAKDPAAGNSYTPKGGLGKYSHMGGRIQIPPGDYSVVVSSVNWNEELDEEVERRLAKANVKSADKLGITTGVLLVLLVITTGFMVIISLKYGFGPRRWLWAGLLVGWTLCVLFMRKLKQLEDDPQRKEIEKEYPAFVVELKE